MKCEPMKFGFAEATLRIGLRARTTLRRAVLLRRT